MYPPFDFFTPEVKLLKVSTGILSSLLYKQSLYNPKEIFKVQGQK